MQRILGIALIALGVMSVALAAQHQTGTLKGKLQNEKGKPLADADVRVMSSRTRTVKEAKTDAAGNYSLELEPDDYTLSFDAEGYSGGTMRDMQQVEAGKATEVKTLQLQKARRTSLVRGSVFDNEGRSLAGARVKIVRIPTEEEAKANKRIQSFARDYTTNTRGEFAFRLPSEHARYRVSATLDGHKSDTKEVLVDENESVPVALSLEPLKKKDH